MIYILIINCNQPHGDTIFAEFREERCKMYRMVMEGGEIYRMLLQKQFWQVKQLGESASEGSPHPGYYYYYYCWPLMLMFDHGYSVHQQMRSMSLCLSVHDQLLFLHHSLIALQSKNYMQDTNHHWLISFQVIFG